MIRRLVVGVAVIAVLSISLLAAGYYWANNEQQLDAQIDTSWTETVKIRLQNYQSYPESVAQSSPDVTISYCNVFVAENGTEQLIYYGNGNELSSYLGELLKDATLQKGTASEELVNRVLENDTVVILTYRASVLHLMNPDAKYYKAYFILQDNLNEGLKGTIIANEINSDHMDILAISK